MTFRIPVIPTNFRSRPHADRGERPLSGRELAAVSEVH